MDVSASRSAFYLLTFFKKPCIIYTYKLQKVVVMRVGLSYSRCVRDIVDGKVHIDDILVVISRTNFDPRDDNAWRGIWLGYRSGLMGSHPEWRGYPDEDEQKFRDVTLDLLYYGKFHQPRQFGAHPKRLPYYWLDVTVPVEELENNPAAKIAWERFVTLAGLGGTNLDIDYV